MKSLLPKELMIILNSLRIWCDIAVHFNNDDRVTEYIVESENFESIHNHSAYAQFTK